MSIKNVAIDRVATRCSALTSTGKLEVVELYSPDSSENRSKVEVGETDQWRLTTCIFARTLHELRNHSVHCTENILISRDAASRQPARCARFTEQGAFRCVIHNFSGSAGEAVSTRR